MLITIDTNHLKTLNADELILAHVIHTLSAFSSDRRVKNNTDLLKKQINVRPRTLEKLLNSLEVKNIITYDEENIQITNVAAKLVAGLDISHDVEGTKKKKKKANQESSTPEGYQFWVDLWNDAYGTSYRLTTSKKQQINARRKKFKRVEIIKALRTRHRDKWLRNEGRKYLPDWDAFWRSDDKVERYLNKAIINAKTESNSTHYITGSVN